MKPEETEHLVKLHVKTKFWMTSNLLLNLDKTETIVFVLNCSRSRLSVDIVNQEFIPFSL